MTAEIAVLNKSAVAMAADSAATIQHDGGQKTYNVNKLFALSSHLPVGIMIYGNANLMSVPWETIIRFYQRHLGNKTFSRLKDYGNDFIKFLDRKNPLFPQSQQADSFRYLVTRNFEFIREQIDDQVREEIDKNGSASPARIEQICLAAIAGEFEIWKRHKNLKHLPKNHGASILKRYGKTIEKIIGEVFQKLSLNRKAIRQLRLMAVSTFTKDRFTRACSGFVIAGFGEKEAYPSLVAYEAESIINNRLKYALFKEKCNSITFENSASVVPFAQQDVVTTFVEGVDPRYRELTESALHGILQLYAGKIVSSMTFLTQSRQEKLTKILKKLGEKIRKDFIEEHAKYRWYYHIIPLIDVVNVLPKDELARMAESLVELTCLKRKMSLNVETVGGPIDVAVISKGEGFIWIKRKHYFDKEFNPQFFTRFNKRAIGI